MELKQSKPYNPYEGLNGRVVRYIAQNLTIIGKVGFRYKCGGLDSIIFSPAINYNAEGKVYEIDGPIISTVIAGVMIPYEQSKTIEELVTEINKEIERKERDKKA